MECRRICAAAHFSNNTYAVGEKTSRSYGDVTIGNASRNCQIRACIIKSELTGGYI